jgi:hypothetical protein
LEDGGERGAGGDEDGVGDGYAGAGGVVDGQRREVLDEGAAVEDVHGLAAVADSEEGFTGKGGVGEEGEVGLFAGGVLGAAGGEAGGVVEGGVDVGGGAGEEEALAGGGEGFELGGREGEGDLDGVAAGVGDGGGVGGPGAPVVGGVDGGGDRDADFGVHLLYHLWFRVIVLLGAGLGPDVSVQRRWGKQIPAGNDSKNSKSNSKSKSKSLTQSPRSEARFREGRQWQE